MSTSTDWIYVLGTIEAVVVFGVAIGPSIWSWRIRRQLRRRGGR